VPAMQPGQASAEKNTVSNKCFITAYPYTGTIHTVLYILHSTTHADGIMCKVHVVYTTRSGHTQYAGGANSALLTGP